MQSPETTFSLFFLCQESSSTSSQVFFALDFLRWGNVLCVCVLSSRSATAVRTPAFSFRVSTTSHSSRSLLKFKDAHCHFFSRFLLCSSLRFCQVAVSLIRAQTGKLTVSSSPLLPASILRLIVARCRLFRHLSCVHVKPPLFLPSL